MEQKGERIKSIRQNKLLDNAFWFFLVVHDNKFFLKESQAFHLFMQIIVINIYLTFFKLDCSLLLINMLLTNSHVYPFILIKIIDENFKIYSQVF